MYSRLWSSWLSLWESAARRVAGTAARCGFAKAPVDGGRRIFASQPLESRRLFAAPIAISAGVHTYPTLAETAVTMTGKSELHVTAASNPIPGSTIHLNSTDAWFWLDNVRPAA